MPHHTGFDDLCGRIDDATDYARGIDVLSNDAAGIDAFKSSAFPFTAVLIEVPPREAILRGNDRSIGAKQWVQTFGNRGEVAMAGESFCQKPDREGGLVAYVALPDGRASETSLL